MCMPYNGFKTIAWVKNGLFKMYIIDAINRISQNAIYMRRTSFFLVSPKSSFSAHERFR